MRIQTLQQTINSDKPLASASKLLESISEVVRLLNLIESGSDPEGLKDDLRKETALTIINALRIAGLYDLDIQDELYDSLNSFLKS